MIHDIMTKQVIKADLATVFSFFEQPANLARLTPPWLGFRILTPPPIPMREGALIDYSIKLGPFPMHWRTLITAFDPPYRFVDEQLSGPYTFWHHTHSFEAVDGGTAISDHVRYTLPLGGLGALAHKLIVRRQLETIFSYREGVVAEMFGTRDNPAGSKWQNSKAAISPYPKGKP